MNSERGDACPSCSRVSTASGGTVGLAATFFRHQIWLPGPRAESSLPGYILPGPSALAHTSERRNTHVSPEFGAPEFCYLPQAWVPVYQPTHGRDTGEGTGQELPRSSRLSFPKVFSGRRLVGSSLGFVLQGPQCGSWIQTESPC